LTGQSIQDTIYWANNQVCRWPDNASRTEMHTLKSKTSALQHLNSLFWIKQTSAKDRHFLMFAAFKQLSSFWQGLTGSST
jgi:hypothetical protein